MGWNAWDRLVISAHPSDGDIRAFGRVCAQISALIDAGRFAEAVDLALDAAEEYVRSDHNGLARRLLAVIEPFASERPRFRALHRWGIGGDLEPPQSLPRDIPNAPVIPLHARVDAMALRGLTECVVRRDAQCGCLHVDVWPTRPRDAAAAFRRSDFAVEVLGERYPIICTFTRWTERGGGRCTCTLMPIPHAAHDRARFIIRTTPDGRASISAIIVAAPGVPRQCIVNAEPCVP